VNELPPEKRCEWLKNSTKCEDLNVSIVKYSQLYFCYFTTPALRYIAAVVLVSDKNSTKCEDLNVSIVKYSQLYFCYFTTPALRYIAAVVLVSDNNSTKCEDLSPSVMSVTSVS
jgi:hypothetical protein